MAEIIKKPVLFEALLEGIFDEAYILDAETLALVAVSETVYVNTGKDFDALALMPLEELLHIGKDFLIHQIQVAVNQTKPGASSKPELVYMDESLIKVLMVQSDGEDYLVVIKNDASSKLSIERALKESKTRFQAIVTNAPGLVCQFKLDADGYIQFDYLSDRSVELLGYSPKELKLDPKQFYEIMNARDRTLLRMRLKLSRVELSTVNWDGRVWIDSWQDTKWINMRCTPRKLNNGDVQWDGFITNITQGMNEKFKMEESQRRLSELTAHMNHIKEDERHRIACEIHDDLGGNLTAIKIGLAAVMQTVKEGKNVDINRLTYMEQIVDSTYEAIHRISSDLRPNIIEFGIVAALEWQAEEFQKQFDLPCEFIVDDPEITVTPDQAMALFRICQEAMSNIAKYAKATQVQVQLNKLNNEVEMLVTDNGVGIKPIDKVKENSFGLRGMQERVKALNGYFKISRVRGDKSGTQVNVRLPIQKNM